jgi:hypothetical protein
MMKSKARRARAIVAAILTPAAIVAALAGCSSPTAKHSASAAPKITESIKSGATLTAPTAWTASVKPVGNDFVAQVNFFIDGKKVWTEANAPYTFNDDDSLIFPWLLGAGTHVLKVTAVFSSGRSASTASTVTTQAAVVPPALVGTFTRNVPRSDYGPTFVNDGTPFGKWTLQIEPSGQMIATVPGGGEGVYEAFTATSTALELQGYRAWSVPKGYSNGGFCNETPEKPDGYTWVRSGNKLTLASPTDLAQCVDRGGLFIGTWTKK